jgi:hypothetical protein
METQKSPKKFCCTSCNYNTSNKYDFSKHLLTAKHKFAILETKKIATSEIVLNNDVEEKLCCELCNNTFKTRSGLWKHKNKNICSKSNYNGVNKNSKNTNSNNLVNDNNIIDINNIIDDNNIIHANNIVHDNKITDDNNIIDENINYKNLLIQTFKENKEFREILVKQQQQISELIPKVGNNNSNNTVKQRFNIQVFLNEQCKNAINLNDFIESIKVSIQQLDYTHNNGLTNGLTNIIMENMKNLNCYERPLHCTDAKRETLYIKNDDCWSKDNNDLLKKAINNISNKQYKAFNNWIQQNPDYNSNESKQYYYAKTLSTIGKSINSIENKIIKNLCNENHLKIKSSKS